MANEEVERLEDADRGGVPWRRWGPYVSDRQWGTVREDTSSNGDAWGCFTHDEARSRAYRWGEDGLAALCDEKQLLCLGPVLWNGHDPILKERLFGLTNSEGNHGEDVKECYFYVDALPTSSYLKMIYKYPQRAFPYDDLVATNRGRGKLDPEYELLDTGVFDDGRYFDVVVEYAKATPEDVLLLITAYNRGPDEATLHVLPSAWYRHTWSWAGGAERPTLQAQSPGATRGCIEVDHPDLGRRWVYSDRAVPILVTGNETNNERVFGSPNDEPYVKDAFHRYVVDGDTAAVDPDGVGTKAAFHYALSIPAGDSAQVRIRFTDTEMPGGGGGGARAGADPFTDFDPVLQRRRAESDRFWLDLVDPRVPPAERPVVRQALSGMLWSKQYYALDMERHLVERGVDPLAADPALRNHDWRHFVAADVISMPDKWEYPWFAAWDLAFHAVALAAVDVQFAKDQLRLLLARRYLHPNGQLPAYEWNFSDVNPPVHAWASWFVYELEKARTGVGDHDFLASVFHPLLRNFGWWLNRKDVDGRNVFQGGFLGLDNIGVFDRSAPLPGGGHLDQADGTAWMALYSENLLQMAIELARQDPIYLEQAQTLLENFLWIAAATDHVGPDNVSLWDEADGFFYDVLRNPDGTATPLRVRSVVGLMPLAAASVLSPAVRRDFPYLSDSAAAFLQAHPAVAAGVMHGRERRTSGPVLFSLFDETRLRRILAAMLDEDEFFSPYGIRSLSRRHLEHPFVLVSGGQEYRVGYLPAESDSGMFGGNSNWRGPVWMPINVMLIRGLLNLHVYYGDSFRIECPTGSGHLLTLYEVAAELSGRLVAAFVRDPAGHRPVFGGQPIMQNDPNWRDLLLFYEYLHGDNGAGIGASHQTGWTGLVGVLPLLFHGFTGPAQAQSDGQADGAADGRAARRAGGLSPAEAFAERKVEA